MIKEAEKFGRVGVLMGGYSSERPISLKSGKAIYNALIEQGIDAVFLDILDSDGSKIKEFIEQSDIDMAFIALHGALGEDGKIQGILKDIDIPYTGSGVQASRLAFNKVVAQRRFKECGLNIPMNIVIPENSSMNANFVKSKIGDFPFVVKPSCEGSSIGITLVHHPEEFEAALITAWQYGDQALVEKFIEGRELTVGMLGNEALPLIEICSKRNFFDFTAKYEKGNTEYIVPAKVDPQIAEDIQIQAVKAHSVLGCSDFSRVDFILGEDKRSYVLEVNTIPGFTGTSLLPKAASTKGINFNQLCYKILEMAYGKKKENKDQSVTI